MQALGIDLGGTNIKAVLADDEGGILAEGAMATLDDGTSAWRSRVAGLVGEMAGKAGRGKGLRLGLAAPGMASRDGRAIVALPDKLPGLENLDWTEFLGWPSFVPVLNDAHAALLGEVWQGAAAGARNAVLLTLGTGVGGAVYADGRLLRGHLGRAGALGHISVDYRGKPDGLGTPGSLEDAIGECSIRDRTGGRFKSTRDLVEAARSGDAGAVEFWRESMRALAAGVTGLINSFDPEVVVIGGGIAEAGELLFGPLGRELDRIEWRPQGSRVRIVKAQLGPRAGALGAARQAFLGTAP